MFFRVSDQGRGKERPGQGQGATRAGAGSGQGRGKPSPSPIRLGSPRRSRGKPGRLCILAGECRDAINRVRSCPRSERSGRDQSRPLLPTLGEERTRSIASLQLLRRFHPQGCRVGRACPCPGPPILCYNGENTSRLKFTYGELYGHRA